MKKIKKANFMAMALAAFTMFSCSNEEIENLGSNAPGEKSVLTINIEGDGDKLVQSRAANAGGTDAQNATIKNYAVFLFRDGGILDCPPYYHTGNTAASITTGTTAAKKAYVIANTGATATANNAIFAGVTTENQLKAVVGDLMVNNNTSTQLLDNLWMAGEGTITYQTGANAHKGAAAVTLKFVAAKIELVVKDARRNNTTPTTDKPYKITDNEVVLLYAGKKGKFFEGTTGDQSVQTHFYTGVNNYPNFSQANTVLSTALKTPVSGSGFGANAGNTVSHHFFTFGNNGATKPTILAIKSTRTKLNDTNATAIVYYPIQFDATDAKNTIEPGKSYKVTMTLSSDVNSGAGGGNGGGTTDPEKPVISSEVSVTITAARWAAVTIPKNFN